VPSNSVRVIARIAARSDTVEDVRNVLFGLIEPTRKEEGCVTYELLQSVADPTEFTFVEEWTSDAALEAHLATDHVQAVLAKTPSLLSGSPDIRRYTLVA
jgi:quinol monooxygenase YgiN